MNQKGRGNGAAGIFLDPSMVNKSLRTVRCALVYTRFVAYTGALVGCMQSLLRILNR